MSRDFDAYDVDFRHHWERTYRTSTSGYNYDEYLPAYQYGYDLATEKRYEGRKWDEVEPEARRAWEIQRPGNAWEDYKEAAEHAYEHVRSGMQD